MRDFLINLFRDDTFGPKMGLFNLTHIIVFLIVIGIIVLMVKLFYKKDEKTKTKVLNIIITIILCLYFGDFFIHPILNNENALIVDKLPFHLCTSACILIALGRMFREKIGKLYHAPVVLGMIGALMYLCVPTGVNGDYLFCYRSLQTIIYHSLLFMFGVLSICFKDIKLSFKTIYVEAIMVVVQIIISLFANAIYSTSDHHYDWYFTTGSSFDVNPYLMPFVMFGILMTMSCIIYGITYLVDYIDKKKDNNVKETA